MHTDLLYIACRKGIWKQNTLTTDRIRDNHVSPPDKQIGIFGPWITMQQKKVHLVCQFGFVKELSGKWLYPGLWTTVLKHTDRIWYPQRSAARRQRMNGRTALRDPWIPTMPSGYFSVSAKFPIKNGNRSVNDCRILTKNCTS